MSRPLRIEFEEACYHVMNRGRGRQQVFHGQDFYQLFLQTLTEAHIRFGLEILAYCLMSNHYHLLLRTPRGNLSRNMRHIDGLYTQRHNRLKRTDGSLFRGRYKAILVDTSNYLLQVSRYIHRNPIETAKPLVRALEDYPWSSYPAYLNTGSVLEGLNRDPVYAELGSRQRFKAYRQFVMQGNSAETHEFYNKAYLPAVMGDSDFLARAEAAAQSLDIEIDRQGLRRPVATESILRAVASRYSIDEADLVSTRRGKGQKNIPRWIAMKLCQDLAGERLDAIAAVFNVGHYSTVSQTIGRLNRLMDEDDDVRRRYKLLSQDLTP